VGQVGPSAGPDQQDGWDSARSVEAGLAGPAPGSEAEAPAGAVGHPARWAAVSDAAKWWGAGGPEDGQVEREAQHGSAAAAAAAAAGDAVSAGLDAVAVVEAFARSAGRNDRAVRRACLRKVAVREGSAVAGTLGAGPDSAFAGQAAHLLGR
jgi:hypothetical protein